MSFSVFPEELDPTLYTDPQSSQIYAIESYIGVRSSTDPTTLSGRISLAIGATGSTGPTGPSAAPTGPTGASVTGP